MIHAVRPVTELAAVFLLSAVCDDCVDCLLHAYSELWLQNMVLQTFSKGVALYPQQALITSTCNKKTA